jgi:putative acetyltransferase
VFDIKLDDLTGDPIIALLNEHLAEMQATSPPESKHALDLTALKDPSVKFWTIWKKHDLAGFAAYKKLNDTHAEIKSMRTSSNYRHQGVAAMLLKHLMKDAYASGFNRLSLETGSMDYFKAARALYLKHGFKDCLPFSDYVEDPNSRFMTIELLPNTVLYHE